MPDSHGSEAGGARLVARLRAGDDAAFEQLVRENGPVLLRVARGFLRNEADAGDALQDAFISIFRGIAQYNFQSSLESWMRRIVINSSLMKIRARARRPEAAIDDLLPKFVEDGHHAIEPRAWTETAESLVERAELRAAVRAAIDRLPQTYRTVLLLRDIEELDTDEAARVLDVSPGTVKVRLHRARQALRTLLDAMINKPEGSRS
ncbi:MAG: sigma-70 family RNA polymerase sigma factor [Planctomycetes bacterium]|nr:sigma-70 family RNA polymerase sigma factor [Planctomycetota bacterium]